MQDPSKPIWINKTKTINQETKSLCRCQPSTCGTRSKALRN